MASLNTLDERRGSELTRLDGQQIATVTVRSLAAAGQFSNSSALRNRPIAIVKGLSAAGRDGPHNTSDSTSVGTARLAFSTRNTNNVS